MNIILNIGQGGSTVPCRDRTGQGDPTMTSPSLECTPTILGIINLASQKGELVSGGGEWSELIVSTHLMVMPTFCQTMFIFSEDYLKTCFPGLQTAILATVGSRTIGQSRKVHVADLFYMYCISSIVN